MIEAILSSFGKWVMAVVRACFPYHTAECAISKTAFLDDATVLPYLFVKSVHRLLGKVLELEVGKEQVT